MRCQPAPCYCDADLISYSGYTRFTTMVTPRHRLLAAVGSSGNTCDTATESPDVFDPMEDGEEENQENNGPHHISDEDESSRARIANVHAQDGNHLTPLHLASLSSSYV